MAVICTIFIDTSEIVGRQFDFESWVFQSLSAFVASGLVRVLATDVTVQEVHAKIKEAVEAAHQGHKTFRRKHSILRVSKSDATKNLVAEWDVDEARTAVETQFDQFLSACDVEVISVDTVTPSVVFERYFERRPPFAADKKKSEFPDAFALEALRKWSKGSGVAVHVVSRDNGMLETCSESGGSLIGVDNLARLLDQVSNKVEAAKHKAIHEGLSAYRAKLCMEVERQFKALGFWLQDQDGEVDEIKVTAVDLGESFIVSADDETAVVELQTLIDFNAEVSYDDLATATYDSEDKVLIPWRKIDTTLEETVVINATVNVAFSLSEPDQFEILEVSIDDDDIGLVAEPGF